MEARTLSELRKETSYQTVANHFDHLSTEELVERFKEATLVGRPPQALVEAMAKRPEIAFIQVTDSTEITMSKARTAIEQIEQLSR
ncbi:hypothetical protein IQ241_12010 [Romeria aff. gracilis LEGE 07310]|uniref:Uncharacterized protein n=1 Tax=Vasconcelosia minhoensis LEGE 07310 TaxID=915328 RepID=A0A8J7DCT3_9CYAN|nr:hypothetical protein [Romeria gracilis]MBE9078008.1 hypothetical protein [Romeria aff. gracilis LEGE 07310]